MRCIVLILLPALLSLSVRAQDSTQAAAAEEKLSSSAEFISIQKNDDMLDLKTTYKVKLSGVFTKIPGLKVEYFYVADGKDSSLGTAVTDRNGMALLSIKAAGLKPDAEGKLHFKAVFAGNKSFESDTEELAIKRAGIILTPVKEDSLLTLQLKLVDLSSGKEVPVPDADLGVYVKRLFNPLKLGEGKTDSSGEASVEIPAAIPGDASGSITLLAKLEESEQYGNIEISLPEPWGKAVSQEIKELPRALWSPHPPIWMLVTFIILMTAVWGHYIVIVLQLIRLRKEEKDIKPTAN